MNAASKQPMFNSAAGLPVGALGAEAIADLDVDEGPADSEIVRAVADAFGLTMLAAVDRIELIDLGAARAVVEAN